MAIMAIFYNHFGANPFLLLIVPFFKLILKSYVITVFFVWGEGIIVDNFFLKSMSVKKAHRKYTRDQKFVMGAI